MREHEWLKYQAHVIDVQLADLAVDMYEDARWRGVEDPLEVGVDSVPRWRRIKELHEQRMLAWAPVDDWEGAHPEALSQIQWRRMSS